MKKNIKEKTFNAVCELIAPLDGKPALVSAIVLTATIAALDEPDFAFFLLILVFSLTHFFRRHLQWVIFVTLAAGIVAHEGFSGNLSQTEVSINQKIPDFGCGTIEFLQKRGQKTIFVVKEITH